MLPTGQGLAAGRGGEQRFWMCGDAALGMLCTFQGRPASYTGLLMGIEARRLPDTLLSSSGSILSGH